MLFEKRCVWMIFPGAIYISYVGECVVQLPRPEYALRQMHKALG
jgi:hypothetical protein